ncbi:MAG: tRNA (guanosine(46)-N7)-methyltransferase TrmB [Planctomycetes bacterium]|nr:tRNA (guanosine(46)-N7)-methyltransferase TrmB [Planctomycetota bacterium]
MTARQLQDYPHLTLQPGTLDGQLDFEVIFGRSGPVEIEIGSGKGTFLVSQAGAFEKTNFLGIEWANKVYRYAVDRIGRWGLKNVRLIRTDAADFLAEHVADESVEGFHLYFPDPWPKKRHHKRRFFCSENLEQMLRCLKPGGWINIATDHQDYFEQIQTVTRQAVEGGRAKIIPFIRPVGAGQGEYVGTNYERKYLKEGRPTYTLALQKL